MEKALKGVLGWKGERGFSAYEIAVKNGYIGSEENWLASIGQTSMFKKNKTTYISVEQQKEFNIPQTYTSNSIIDIYVNGLKLSSKEYSINMSSRKIVLSNELDKDAEVEIVVTTMTTSHLPIVTVINENSIDTTVPSSKATYDFITNKFIAIKGTIPTIPVGENSSLEFEFPSGFTKENCVIISKMCKSGEFWNDCTDITNSKIDVPILTNIKLGEKIIVDMKNLSNTVKDGQFKIVLAKI